MMISVPTGYMMKKDILDIAQVYKEVAVQGNRESVERQVDPKPKDILGSAQVYKEVAVQGDMRPVVEPVIQYRRQSTMNHPL